MREYNLQHRKGRYNVSTKIYGGFIIESKSLEEIYDEVVKLREEIDVMANKYVSEYIMQVAMWTFDRIVYARRFMPEDESYLTSSALMYSECMFRDRIDKIKNKGTRDPEVDVEFELLFFPLPDKRIIGVSYCEQTMFIKKWMERPFVREYGYWNNTDPDPDCTEEEWYQRGKDWEVALEKQGGIPAMNGVSMTVLVPEYHTLFYNIENLMKTLEKPVTVRAKRVVSAIMRNEYFIQHDSRNKKRGQLVQMTTQFERDILQGPLKDDFDARCTEVEKQMKPFTVNMLLTEKLIDHLEAVENKET